MNQTIPDQPRTARGKLLERASLLRERLQRVRSDLRREREPLPRDSADAAIVVENDEVLLALEQTALRELAALEAALERIEHGAYGICETCSRPIDAERLRVVPYAAQCQACAPEE
jgi:RNA polymerase-binding transcription factor DksA